MKYSVRHSNEILRGSALRKQIALSKVARWIWFADLIKPVPETNPLPSPRRRGPSAPSLELGPAEKSGRTFVT